MDLPVDVQRYQFRPAGTVRPVFQWDERKGRSTDIPETNPAGVPLWDIDLIVQGQAWGKATSGIYPLRVPAPKEPDVSNGQPLQLEHPMVSVFMSKGQLRLNFSAAGIAGAPSGRRSEQAA